MLIIEVYHIPRHDETLFPATDQLLDGVHVDQWFLSRLNEKLHLPSAATAQNPTPITAATLLQNDVA